MLTSFNGLKKRLNRYNIWKLIMGFENIYCIYYDGADIT